MIELVERNLNYLSERAPLFPAPRRVLSGEPGTGGARAQVAVLEDGKLAGYVRLEGTLAGAVDERSPIYVEADGTLYEASPVGVSEDWEIEKPFTLYVPEGGVGAEKIRVLYLLDGQVFEAGQVDFSHAQEKGSNVS